MTATTTHIDALRDRLPEAAKDLRLNLQSVLSAERLSAEQTWGTALASAYFVGSDELAEALIADAQANGVDDNVIDDAKAAASLMAMNTVYYRFRGLVEKEDYSKLPARLRMARIAKPATDKATFELFAMACAALAGCHTCIKAHEASLIKHGLTIEHVHDAVRLGAVVNGVATALRL
ncbi:MAG: carboxymuconolactone decarboxylase family protein [Phycisphaeraceae bacterium]